MQIKNEINGEKVCNLFQLKKKIILFNNKINMIKLKFSV